MNAILKKTILFPHRQRAVALGVDPHNPAILSFFRPVSTQPPDAKAEGLHAAARREGSVSSDGIRASRARARVGVSQKSQ